MVLATGVELDGSVIPVLHTGWTDRTWGTETFWHDMIYLDTSVAELMVERGAIGSDDFTLVAAPLRLKGMDGAPARVFALVE